MQPNKVDTIEEIISRSNDPEYPCCYCCTEQPTIFDPPIVLSLKIQRSGDIKIKIDKEGSWSVESTDKVEVTEL